MASPKNLKTNGNPNNSTPDERVLWEDGTWAIVEAGDYPVGIGRTRTCDTPGDTLSATWEAGLITAPGAKSIAARKLVKVQLADLLANTPPRKAVAAVAAPRDFIPAPPSPFLPKPWGRVVPEFPHLCRVCGGRFYQGLMKTVHEATEGAGGACPGPAKMARSPRA